VPQDGTSGAECGTPLIFSFFGARPRWPAAKRGLQEHTELPAKGCRWITMQPCGLWPNVASKAPWPWCWAHPRSASRADWLPLI